MTSADFAELIRQGQALFQTGSSDSLLALRSLSLDAERANTIRNVDGSVAFEISDEAQVRTLLLSPGVAVAGKSPPACTVRIAAADFWALSRGEKNPFELLMDGKIRLQGRMEVAMALSSVLMG
jgi:putative sterol carrier protein